MLNDDERRRALERVAYGDSASAAESAAARRELELLGPGVETGTEREPELEGEATGDRDPAPEAPKEGRRRGRVVAALAGVLVVGLVGGGLLDHAVQPGGSGTAASSTDGATAGAAGTTNVTGGGATGEATDGTGSERFDGDPSVEASSRELILAAETLLGRPATAEDAFPSVGGTNELYQPSTIRLVATTQTKNKVFIARKAGSSGGYCLLALGSSETGDAGLGTASCSLPGPFVHQGVVLGATGYQVTWKGGRIDVTIGN